MAKMQEDWVFIGLGIGALYLLYKSSEPVVKAIDSVSGVVQSAGNLSSNVLDKANDAVDLVSKPFSPVTNTFPTVSDYLFKSPVVTAPKLVNSALSKITDYVKSLFSPAKKSSSSNNANSAVIKTTPAQVQMKTNIASSQGLVSVVPKNPMSAVKLQVSPFTGQLFTKK